MNNEQKNIFMSIQSWSLLYDKYIHESNIKEMRKEFKKLAKIKNEVYNSEIGTQLLKMRCLPDKNCSLQIFNEVIPTIQAFLNNEDMSNNKNFSMESNDSIKALVLTRCAKKTNTFSDEYTKNTKKTKYRAKVRRDKIIAH